MNPSSHSPSEELWVALVSPRHGVWLWPFLVGIAEISVEEFQHALDQLAGIECNRVLMARGWSSPGSVRSMKVDDCREIVESLLRIRKLLVEEEVS